MLSSPCFFFFHLRSKLKEYRSLPVKDETQGQWCRGTSVAKVPTEMSDQTNAFAEQKNGLLDWQTKCATLYISS